MAEDKTSEATLKADQLLETIKQQEVKRARGRLKVFLGMSAGVGKTFEMLSQAQALLKSGVDVVVGVVETHGRKETEAILSGLTIIPRKKISYRDVQLEEMDLDAILARKPELVLVDELAHTNVPTSRHEKRYQDVLEILEAGINVFTTINIQHIESRKDIVQSITGVFIREAVPDSIFDVADHVELVDLPPDALLQRLQEGKVYLGEKAQAARESFFTKGNLTALRELSLRLTAERVDHELRDFVREKIILSPHKTSEKLMVAVAATQSSERLIRWTRKTAYNLESPWVAVYVETKHKLTDEERGILRQNLNLAKELGAEIVTTADVDVTRALLRTAKQRSVTQIIVGKPTRNLLHRVFGETSPLQRLIEESGDIDIHVVNVGKSVPRPISELMRKNFESRPKDYLYAVITLVAAIIVGLLCQSFISYSAVGLLLLLVILVQGVYLGRGPILVSAALGAILWNFLFIPPKYTFFVSRFEDVLLLLIFFVGAIVTGTLAAKTSAREKTYRSRELYAAALYLFSRQLSKTRSIDEIVEQMVKSLTGLFSTDIAVFVRTPEGKFPTAAHPKSGWQPEEKERTIADWAFNNLRMTGRFTDTLSEAEALHMPLLAGAGATGVVSIRPRRRRVIIADQIALLESFSSSAAIALEKEFLSASDARAKASEEAERLHKALLHSISHELRTPITAIAGASSGLWNKKIALDDKSRENLLKEIDTANDRMNRLVANLLDMSRLESGHLRPKLEWCEPNDIVAAVIDEIRDPKEKSRIEIQGLSDLPMIYCDFVLTEQALLNVVHNAIFHTPAGSRITIVGTQTEEFINIKVEDEGAGFNEEDIVRVYEKFFRVNPSSTGGLGLGLSIVKGFMEAQGGAVHVENRREGGARVTLQFPHKPIPEMPREGA